MNNIESFELYNTIEDPSEIENLYHDDNEIAITLKKELDDWFDSRRLLRTSQKTFY